MATRNISIINGVLPDSSGDTYFEMKSVAFDTTPLTDHFLLAMDDAAAAHGVTGQFRVPDDYVGTPVLVAICASTGTSSACHIDFRYKAKATAEAGDPTTDDQDTGADITTNGTAKVIEEETISLGANFAAGDTVEFEFSRDPTDAQDTYAGSLYVFDVVFRYSDA